MNGGFVQAENAAESERLFRAMSVDELVQNCLAANKLLAERIAETEITRLGKQAEKLNFAQDRIIRATLRNLQSIAKLTGRQNRVVREEALDNLSKIISRFLIDSGELVPISWPPELERVPGVREVDR